VADNKSPSQPATSDLMLEAASIAQFRAEMAPPADRWTIIHDTLKAKLPEAQAAVLFSMFSTGFLAGKQIGNGDGADAAVDVSDSGLASTADILIVTVLPEEYRAVLSRMAKTRTAQGTVDMPNAYAWRIGNVARKGGGAYRVALALVGGPGNANASLAVTNSVSRWRPRYVMLVGCAGGFSQGGCGLGDVVVSTEVYGYELGKIEDGFQPRPNWTYQVDVGLRASAQGFFAANPEWSEATDGTGPKVLFGTVAAGDKVVDDPTDPVFGAVLKLWPKLQAVEMEAVGAAAAIEHLRASGNFAGFIVVRGISDMPRPRSKRATKATQTGERDANKRRACEAAARFVMRWIAAEWPVAPGKSKSRSRAVESRQ
jgi:nucleoside phosphorylase